MDESTIFSSAEELRLLKEEKKQLEARAKELGTRIEAMEEALTDGMAERELEKFSYKGHTFYLNSRLYASPAAGRKEDMIAAMKENGYGDLVTETVNAQTLASFIREQREATGLDVPEWLGEKVTVFEKATIGIRKG